MRIERTDDVTAHLDAMLTAWEGRFGNRGGTIREATRGTDQHPVPEDLMDAMLEIAEDRPGALNKHRLGNWLIRMEGRILKGCRFVKQGKSGTRTIWKVEKHGS